MLSGFAGKTVAAHSKVSQSRSEIREGREASSGHGCSISVMIPVAREGLQVLDGARSLRLECVRGRKGWPVRLVNTIPLGEKKAGFQLQSRGGQSWERLAQIYGETLNPTLDMCGLGYLRQLLGFLICDRLGACREATQHSGRWLLS